MEYAIDNYYMYSSAGLVDLTHDGLDELFVSEDSEDEYGDGYGIKIHIFTVEDEKIKELYVYESSEIEIYDSAVLCLYKENDKSYLMESRCGINEQIMQVYSFENSEKTILYEEKTDYQVFDEFLSDEAIRKFEEFKTYFEKRGQIIGKIDNSMYYNSWDSLDWFGAVISELCETYGIPIPEQD